MNSEGIGLGLTISKSLVEINGGKLIVDSQGVDQGAHFMFAMRMEETFYSKSAIEKIESELAMWAARPPA